MVSITYSKKVLMLCLAVLFLNNLHAANIRWHSTIRYSNGVYVSINPATATTTVQIGTSSACPYIDKNITDIITFGVDHDNIAYISDSSVITAYLDVYRYAVIPILTSS